MAKRHLEDVLGGREVETPFGRCLLIEKPADVEVALPVAGSVDIRCNLKLVYGIGEKTEEKLVAQGYRTISDLARHPKWGARVTEIAREIESRDVRALVRKGASDAEALAFFGPGDIAFVDIETCGLSGTNPVFLVGVLGLSEFGEGPVLRQFLARDLDEEEAMLYAAAEELGRYRVLFTYNGKSFDIPYLRNRLAYAGIPADLGQLNVDMLRHVRRKFRHILPDCSLRTVGARVLGRPRKGDIPGEKIPEVYYEFVRTGEPCLIEPIIHHNEMDLCVLAEITYLVG